MRLALTLTLALCLAALVQGQSPSCGQNCTGYSFGDDLFAGTGYGTWGLAYVHETDQPIIKAVHPASITTAAIIIHGLQRDAEEYYCYFKYALEEAGKLDSTFFIAPRFAIDDDLPLPANQFYWVSNTAWMTGGKSDMATSRIPSFQILDDILMTFSNKTYYPGLEQILIVGHSAGAQMAQRYAIATGIEHNVTVPIRYVVENAGSYTYLDTTRALLYNVTTPDCFACNATQILAADNVYTFQTVDHTSQQACTDYNTWKMGLDGGNVYVNRRSTATIRTEYGTKNVTYLLGTDDTCNDALGGEGICGCDDSSLDTGCDAEMQGYCRLQRGVIYYQYLQQYYKTQTHKVVYVEGLAHDGCGMITSVSSLQSMFPDFDPSATTGSTNTSTSTTDASSTTSSATTDASSTSASSSTGAATSTTGASTVTYTVTITFSGTCSDFNSTVIAVITQALEALGITVQYNGCTDSSKRASSASAEFTVTVPSTSSATSTTIQDTVSTSATAAGVQGVSVNVQQTSSTTSSSTGCIATLSIVVFVLSLLSMF